MAFAAAAAVCAGLAAGATGGTGTEIASQYGALREVVVATEPLPARRALRGDTVETALEVRRVPERFLPPDALTSPAQALGRSPAGAIPPGGYLLGSQLATPGPERERPRALGAGRRPVEITVAAAGALASESSSPGGRVDVVVTTEPGPGGGSGRTYVAASSVRLLDLRPATSGSSGDEILAGPPTENWVSTLALRRGHALRLIHAESFARSVRLLPR